LKNENKKYKKKKLCRSTLPNFFGDVSGNKEHFLRLINMQRTSAIEFFCCLEQVCFSPSLSASASIFLILTNCFFGGMMSTFDIIYSSLHVKICVKSTGHRTVSGWSLTTPAGHRPMFSYTDAGRRPYDMWPRKRKFFKIVRCPGDYQIRRWCANRWNRTMSLPLAYIYFAYNRYIWTITCTYRSISYLQWKITINKCVFKLAPSGKNIAITHVLLILQCACFQL